MTTMTTKTTKKKEKQHYTNSTELIATNEVLWKGRNISRKKKKIKRDFVRISWCSLLLHLHFEHVSKHTKEIVETVERANVTEKKIPSISMIREIYSK